MLLLSLMQDEYFVIGGDIFVHVTTVNNGKCSIGIQADSRIPIVRGSVYEKGGGERPKCFSAPPKRARKYRREGPDPLFYWNDMREQSVKTLEKLAEYLEQQGDENSARIIRTQIDHLIPKPWEDDQRVR